MVKNKEKKNLIPSNHMIRIKIWIFRRAKQLAVTIPPVWWCQYNQCVNDITTKYYQLYFFHDPFIDGWFNFSIWHSKTPITSIWANSSYESKQDYKYNLSYFALMDHHPRGGNHQNMNYHQQLLCGGFNYEMGNNSKWEWDDEEV